MLDTYEDSHSHVVSIVSVGFDRPAWLHNLTKSFVRELANADRLSHRNTYTHAPSPLKIVILNPDAGGMTPSSRHDRSGVQDRKLDGVLLDGVTVE